MNIINRSGPLLSFLALGALLGRAEATLVASYSFAAGSTASAAPGPFLTAGNYLLDPDGSGGNLGGTSGTGDPSDGIFVRTNNTTQASGKNATSTTLGDAISNDLYHAFSFTIAPGYQLSLTSLDFDYGFTDSSATTDSDYLRVYLLTSADGFSAADSVGSVDQPGYPATGGFQAVSIDASLVTELTGAVEARLYFSDSVNNNSVIHRLDNIALTGVVSAIPEPSLLTAFAAVAGVLVLRPRRVRCRRDF